MEGAAASRARSRSGASREGMGSPVGIASPEGIRSPEGIAALGSESRMIVAKPAFALFLSRRRSEIGGRGARAYSRAQPGEYPMCTGGCLPVDPPSTAQSGRLFSISPELFECPARRGRNQPPDLLHKPDLLIPATRSSAARRRRRRRLRPAYEVQLTWTDNQNSNLRAIGDSAEQFWHSVASADKRINCTLKQ